MLELDKVDLILKELREIRHRVEKIEMIVESRFIPVEEPSEDDIKAIEEARRDMEEGRAISLEEAKKKLLEEP